METTSFNGKTYDIAILKQTAEHLPIEQIAVETLKEQVSDEHTYWLDRDGHKLGPFHFLKDWEAAKNTPAWQDHAATIEKADLAQPLFIMRDSGIVIDGMHRLTKAFLDHKTTLPAQYFDELPTDAQVSPLELRSLKETDKEHFAQWWRDTELLAMTSGAPPVTEEELDGYFSEMIHDAEAQHFMIDIDGETIGHISLGQREDGWYETQIVIGNKDYWGYGYGPEAINELLRRTKKQGIEKIYLEVWPHNTRAIRAYEKAGFVRTRGGELLRMEYKGKRK